MQKGICFELRERWTFVAAAEVGAGVWGRIVYMVVAREMAGYDCYKVILGGLREEDGGLEAYYTGTVFNRKREKEKG